MKTLALLLLLSTSGVAQTVKVYAPTGRVQAAIVKIAETRHMTVTSADRYHIGFADREHKYSVNLETTWPKGSNFLNSCGWGDKCNSSERVWIEGSDGVLAFAAEFLAEVKKAAESHRTFHSIMTELPSKAD